MKTQIWGWNSCYKQPGFIEVDEFCFSSDSLMVVDRLKRMNFTASFFLGSMMHWLMFVVCAVTTTLSLIPTISSGIPLFDYLGTSLLVLFIGLGCLLSVIRTCQKCER